MNILLGVTGSVAASLTPKLVEALKALGDVRVVMTAQGLRMSKVTPAPADFSDHSAWYGIKGTRMFEDADEQTRWTVGDPVLHIDLKNWADVLVIAPCTANTLAKIANGLSDNLLTNIVRAWPTQKPLFIAPAMNTDMWEHPLTSRHMTEVMDLYYRYTVFVYPQEKVLACGDKGVGAMAEISDIVSHIKDRTSWALPFAEKSQFVPPQGHPGSFGAVRKHDVHAGVDLYCTAGTPVWPVEEGTVIDIIDFTGANVVDNAGNPMTWWRDTKAVLVKGRHGVVVYGEVDPVRDLKVGDFVTPYRVIANVIQVLPDEKLRPDIEGHSTSMLHLELHATAEDELAFRNNAQSVWELGALRPKGLLDPTELLLGFKTIDPYDRLDRNHNRNW